MAVQRCPKCGRAANGNECLACGHSWTDPPAAAPKNPFASSSTPTSNGSLPPPKADAAKPQNPFGTPSLAPHIAQNPFASGAPKPVTGLHNVDQVPSAPTSGAVTPEISQSPVVQPPRPTPASRPTTPAVATSQALPEPPDSEPEAPVDALPPAISAPPPRNEIERFLRSHLAVPTIGAAVFLSILILGLVISFSGRDDLLDEIDAGVEGARMVLQRLEAVGDRTPREDLMMGHARALLGQPVEALNAYKAAARRSATDERALDYVLLALDNPFDSAELPREVLSLWPGDDVDDRLDDMTKAKTWHQRHNALDAIGKRGKSVDATKLRVAYLDLKDDSITACEDINEALDVVRDYGSGDKAIDAVAEFRGTSRLRCAADRLPAVEAAIKKRGG